MPASDKQLDSSAEPVSLDEIQDPIREDLQAVDNLIKNEIEPDNPVLEEAIEHNQTTRGKRMRPTLLLYSARVTGEVTDLHHRVAAILELIHAATLVHDDVLDRGEYRRKHITLHEKFGNELAVLFGDFIFSSAYRLTSEIEDRGARTTLSRTAGDVCKGEVWQTGNKFNYELSEATYLEIIRLKTASLFSACGKLGAKINNAGDRTEGVLTEFGKNFGMAFQIVDDYLDLTGNENKLGKSLGTDLYKGKLTLPVIRLFSLMDDNEREEAITLIKERSAEKHQDSPPESVDGEQAEEDRKELRRVFIKWLSEYNLAGGYRQFAGEYLEKARTALSELPARSSVDYLHKLIDFAEQREW